MNPDTLFYYRPEKNPSGQAPEAIDCDVLIYGATPAGITAAIQVRLSGYRVILAEIGGRVGGVTASGLGATDIGNKHVIGGLARQFYQRVGQHYGAEEAWTFEPHVAERAFLEMLKEADVPVRFRQALAAVRKEGTEIREVEMEDGTVIRARQFIDTSYEGDLMAKAGVSFIVGREANSVYDEMLNGIQFGHPHHNFRRFVDPYRIAGDPKSGLCAGVTADEPGRQGNGDHRVQAYNFRLCLTNRDDIRRPFPCPPGYDPERYELLRRYLATGVWDVLHLSRKMPEGKTDTNNYGGFSTDHIGANHDWPTASYARREELFQDHVNYTAGLLYFLTHDPNIPATVREAANEWGLAADEFTATGGWPHALYVREGRRMVSDYIMTEHNAVGRDIVPDAVGMAAYTMDSHHCRRVVRGGRVCNEGDVQIGGTAPYPVSYRSICPKESECGNLLVPWCLSASHIAFGSIRMEPVGMVLGQSAAFAAVMAIEAQSPVQRVGIGQLQQRLREAGQVLEVSHEASIVWMEPRLL